jgi:hypothetical protein
MDNAQLPKSSGSWVNRVRMMVGGEPRWVTVPLLRPHGGALPIAEVEINESSGWRSRVVRTLRLNYAKAAHANEVLPFVEEIVQCPANRIADYNRNGISALAGLLGLSDVRMVLGSTLAVSGSATDLLVSMVKAVGGTGYLCGAGAAGYQEDEKFAAAGLDLVHQHFDHPTYHPVGATFVPGLSVVDVLLNQGVQWTRDRLSAARS